MLSSKRKRTRATGVPSPIARTLVIAFTISAAGCSAEVTRFDFSGNGRNNTTSSIPVPPEPVGSGYGPNQPPRGLGLTEAPLPPPSDMPNNTYRTVGRDYDTPPPASFSDRPPEQPGNYRVIGRQYKTPPPAETPPQLSSGPGPGPSFRQSPPPDAGGNTVDVQPGETLYSIGRRHGVTPAAIREANGLTSDSVRPGQRLVIPRGAGGAQDLGPFARPSPRGVDRTQTADNQPPPAPFAPDRMTAPRQTPAAAPAVEGPPGWEGRYTMKNGDSLHGIAIRHRVTLEELKRANGITDPTKVWAGTVLNVPGERDPASAPATLSNTPPRITTVPPRIINAVPEQIPASEQKFASRGDVTNDATPPQFSWPVRGRILAGYGRRPDGTHNDGVNVSVPQGTDIRAAESGTVAYAGNELKGYGNLVLIRHSNGWVTAYAHADQVLVKKDDEVRRGQVIAKAGRTGAVDQPQVHFELRQGTRPVDPTPHLPN